jgi:hypothetical protein
MIRSLSILAVLGLLTVAACGGDRATGPQANFVGQYTLTKAAGAALPWTITGFTCENSIRGGELIVSSDFHLEGSIAYRYDCRTGGTSAPVSGTWDFAGTWTGAGGQLLLIHDSLSTSREFGPVLTDGTLAEGGLNITVELRDCKDSGLGSSCQNTTQTSLGFTK